MSQQKTNLVQKSIGSISSATDHFAVQGNNTPIVLIPRPRSCCSCTMEVPTGPLCIPHSWGKDSDRNSLAATGLTFACCWNEVAYAVQKGAITYNAPVKSCPTADNVMVDCDLVLVFQIGPQPKKVRDFCYKLGARRFDEFLYAAVEEAIRQLIRTCLHTEVYELKGGQDKRVVDTLAELNKKFGMFGVDFSRMAITDVRFKKTLQETLQKVTEYGSMIKEQNKKQKHMMDHIEFTRSQKVQELEQMNRRYIQAAQADRTRVEIDRSRLQVDAVSKAEVNCTRQRQKASVAEAEAQSLLHTTKALGLKNQEEVLADVRARERQDKIKVAQECKSDIFAATSRRDAARAEAQAVILDANAEEAASGSLKIMREHELRMAKMEVLQGMASNNKIVISGEQGDRLISELMDSSILGSMTLCK